MLKRIFSSFGKNHWKAYAIYVNAEYIDGGILHSDQIIISKSFYKIHISLGTNQRGNAGLVYTRFRCAYTSLSPLYFKIKKRSCFSWLFSQKKLKCLPNTSILYNYSIKFNSEDKICLFLSDSLFIDHLYTLSNFKFLSEKDDGLYGPSFPSNEHQLCIEILQEIKSPLEFNKVITILDYAMELLLKHQFLSAEAGTLDYKKT